MFWFDFWCVMCLLKDSFSEQFGFVLHKDALVVDLWEWVEILTRFPIRKIWAPWVPSRVSMPTIGNLIPIY